MLKLWEFINYCDIKISVTYKACHVLAAQLIAATIIIVYLALFILIKAISL